MNRQVFSCLMHKRIESLLVKYRLLAVKMNSFSDTKRNSDPEKSDCLKESKDYFKDKLMQYGFGTKMPIKTLLGFHSDAPPQIRKVLRKFRLSTRNKEFKKFLLQHSDTFQVENESVLLVECNNSKDGSNNMKLESLCENNCPKLNRTLSSPPISIGPYASQSNQNTRVISTTKESMVITDTLLSIAISSDEPIVVSLDCESIANVNGKLSIIQLGTTHGEAFIFDVQTCPQIVKYGGLKSVLESDRVIKIIHDCRGDSHNLFAQFHIILRKVFDTQVAQVILQCQEQWMPIYEVDNLSLDKLCQWYNVPSNPLKDKVKQIYVKNPSYWAERPLSSDMLLYAAQDVLVLINEQLYGSIASAIKPEFKTLLSELCAERILMPVIPSEIRRRVNQRNTADLRKRLSMENVVLTDREVYLLEHSDLTEDEKEKARTLRKSGSQTEQA